MRLRAPPRACAVRAPSSRRSAGQRAVCGLAHRRLLILSASCSVERSSRLHVLASLSKHDMLCEQPAGAEASAGRRRRSGGGRAGAGRRGVWRRAAAARGRAGRQRACSRGCPGRRGAAGPPGARLFGAARRRRRERGPAAGLSADDGRQRWGRGPTSACRGRRGRAGGRCKPCRWIVVARTRDGGAAGSGGGGGAGRSRRPGAGRSGAVAGPAGRRRAASCAKLAA